MMNLEIGVCGNESLSVTNETDLQYFFRHAQVNGTTIPTSHIVDYEFLDGLFKVEFNDGFEECYNSMIRLCLDKMCEKEYDP